MPWLAFLVLAIVLANVLGVTSLDYDSEYEREYDWSPQPLFPQGQPT